MSKPTPGPWTAGRDMVIGCSGGAFTVVAERIENPADIPVLAAAKDMLETLRFVERHLNPRIYKAVLHQVRATIAKAESGHVG